MKRLSFGEKFQIVNNKLSRISPHKPSAFKGERRAASSAFCEWQVAGDRIEKASDGEHAPLHR
jgi:hypothetical protein